MAQDATPKVLSTLDASFHLTIPESVSELFINIMPMHAYGAFEVNPKERSEVGQSLRMIAVCMRPLSTPIKPIEYSRSTASRRELKRPTYIFVYISATIRRILLQLNILLLPRMRYVRCQFGCDVPLMRGTLLTEHTHYLFASICASIRVTFLKLCVRAQNKPFTVNVQVGGLKSSVSVSAASDRRAVF